MNPALLKQLKRIADGVERLTVRSRPESMARLASDNLYRWTGENLLPIRQYAALPLRLLFGIDTQKQALYENTHRFLSGYPGQHALLWGARGCGKSALIKSVWRELHAPNRSMNGEKRTRTALIAMPLHISISFNYLLDVIDERFDKAIIFIDELGFDSDDESLPVIKTLLDGALQQLNVLVYATSNRRHLLARAMVENTDLIAPKEAIDVSVSLSDRFGLWLGFHPIAEDTWLAILDQYLHHCCDHSLSADEKNFALQWQQQRGSRSGRLAWQCFLELAHQRQQPLTVIQRRLGIGT